MQNLAIIGFLGENSKLVEVQDGKPFVTFNLACSTKNKQGETQTQWYSCKSSQVKLQEHLIKGKKLYVSGRPTFSVYTDKDEQAKISVSVSVDKIEFC